MKDGRITAIAGILILAGTLHAGDFTISREDILDSAPPPTVAGKALQQDLPAIEPYTLDSLLQVFAKEGLTLSSQRKGYNNPFPEKDVSGFWYIGINGRIHMNVDVYVFRNASSIQSYEFIGGVFRGESKVDPRPIYYYYYVAQRAKENKFRLSGGQDPRNTGHQNPQGLIRVRNVLITASIDHLELITSMLGKSGETVDQMWPGRGGHMGVRH